MNYGRLSCGVCTWHRLSHQSRMARQSLNWWPAVPELRKCFIRAGGWGSERALDNYAIAMDKFLREHSWYYVWLVDILVLRWNRTSFSSVSFNSKWCGWCGDGNRKKWSGNPDHWMWWHIRTHTSTMLKKLIIYRFQWWIVRWLTHARSSNHGRLSIQSNWVVIIRSFDIIIFIGWNLNVRWRTNNNQTINTYDKLRSVWVCVRARAKIPNNNNKKRKKEWTYS